jgi:hypothetical protein
MYDACDDLCPQIPFQWAAAKEDQIVKQKLKARFAPPSAKTSGDVDDDEKTTTVSYDS